MHPTPFTAYSRDPQSDEHGARTSEVRLPAGIENIDDIIADLDAALRGAKVAPHLGENGQRLVPVG
jgi:O-acetylhomoserine/O-acetylserine sulfhydrylase-like pyridoxal-dependent enzyme